jgi:hypothetical protein
MIVLVIFFVLVCVGLVGLFTEHYTVIPFVVLMIIGIACMGMIANGKEAAPAAKAEIESLRQTLIDNGLATYTPVVVEKKFELIVPNAEKKEEVK